MFHSVKVSVLLHTMLKQVYAHKLVFMLEGAQKAIEEWLSVPSGGKNTDLHMINTCTGELDFGHHVSTT